jgi:hypothetical protein
MFRSYVTAAARCGLLSAFFAGILPATTISSLTGTLVTRGDNTAALHNPSPLSAYSGVAALSFDTTGGCSGVAVGARAVLTAAHCLTNGAGVIDVNTATLNFATGFSTSSTSFLVHPLWNGNLLTGVDLAIIFLAQDLPSDISIYSLYNQNNEINLILDIAGYGSRASNGQPDGSAGAFGTLRRGSNTWDGTLQTMVDNGLAGTAGRTDVVLLDFDSGQQANNGWSFHFGISSNVGTDDESSLGLGDSGAPAFINGRVAGIGSFLVRFNSPGVGTSDSDSLLNSTYGEFAGFTRISTHADWVSQAAQSAVPEPGTWALAAIGLGLAAWRRRK